MTSKLRHRNSTSRVRARLISWQTRNENRAAKALACLLFASLIFEVGCGGSSSKTVTVTHPATYTYSVLHSFEPQPDGGHPTGTMALDAVTGNLYGTTTNGGSFAFGTVFKVDSAGNETLPYSFLGLTDGGFPTQGQLILDGGKLYGTTFLGGVNNASCNGDCGVVLKLDTANGTETALHNFAGADGARPEGGLVVDAAGNLYGTTTFGGACSIAFGCGVVFKLDTTGTESVLHTFTGGADGGFPEADLIADGAGNLYGTTIEGGVTNGGCASMGGCGVVFHVDPTGNETVLYSFTGEPDGASPFAGLVIDNAGNLYGTTFSGGAASHGTVFKIDSTGKETVLYSFAGTPDGAGPASADLILDAAGNIYGTTGSGGATGVGTVFRLDPTGKETVIYSFTGLADGAQPVGGLVMDAAGNLYGTTAIGGTSGCPIAYGSTGCGVVFKLTLAP